MEPGFSPETLTDAAFHGDMDGVRSLVEAGVDVNAAGRVWNPLHAAIENNQIEMVRYLLSVGASPNFRYNGWPALHHAIDAEMDVYVQANAESLPNADLVMTLVEAGADISVLHDGQTPLQFAVWYHHEAAIKYLQSQSA